MKIEQIEQKLIAKDGLAGCSIPVRPSLTIKEKARIRAKLWYQNNKEGKKEKARSYYWKNCEKIREIQRGRRKNNPEKIRSTISRHRKKHNFFSPEKILERRFHAAVKTYGIEITFEEYVSLFQKSGNRCGICGEAPDKRGLAIDHCHETGRARGFLCMKCNLGLGLLGDSVQGISRAIVYLEKVW